MPNTFCRMLALRAVLLIIPSLALGQSTNATITGQVADPTKAVLPQATVRAINNTTNVQYEGMTNQSGTYLIPSLPPGDYRIEVEKTGFKTIIKPDILLHVQDTIELNFEMAVGSTAETVTVSGGAPLVNTENASVSTVVDRQFVENMPLNGRSFQTLISLSPGVVATAASFFEEGQFSVNGQRADANYFMVDGVSANFGTSAGFGLVQGLGGGLPGLSALGSTNSLVSVDAMQEFRIQTSTFAPEFGRTPGAQVSIVTRAGTNQFHGVLFDYLRNDVLDARDWFVNHNRLPKPRERQNDFGGVLGGPIVLDRTFFFFSYEGLRLRQPSAQITFVPDLAARQAAPAAIQPFLNAFPLPNGSEVGGSVAQFIAGYSNPSSIDAYSGRLDQVFGSKFTFFARYNHSPSSLHARVNTVLSNIMTNASTTDTATVGLTAVLSSRVSSEFRANYSNAKFGTSNALDAFGGALPLSAATLPLPTGFTPTNSLFVLNFSGNNGLGTINVGKNVTNEQRQANIIDSVSWYMGGHQFKFGIDYRWLAPISSPLAYQQIILFSGLTGATGALGSKASILLTAAFAPTAFLSRNVSIYGQDTWKLNSRTTVTYGLRWDVNPAVTGKNSKSAPLALENVNNSAALTVAPFGTPLYSTSFTNIAPRLGIAYQLRRNERWSTTIRGGIGIFYDAGSGGLGQVSAAAPFRGNTTMANVPYPFTAGQVAPPPLSSSPPFTAPVVSADPSLGTPRTYEWNVSADQGLGSQQLLSLTYVGAVGRDLLRQDTLSAPNSSFRSTVAITRNSATSDYHALQAKIQKRLSHGVQALLSYTWSHSIDIASNDSSTTNTPPSIGVRLDRGNSDYDVRHSLSGAVSWEVPVGRIGGLGRAVLGGWSVDDFVTARSALPVTVLGNPFTVAGTLFAARPNIVSGTPVYLYGAMFPGGKAFNPSAFVSTVGATQGDLPRNFLRGFAAFQDDFSLRRQFRITERVGLQCKVDAFNVFNHPNFGNPVATRTSPAFGLSTQTLAQALSPGGASGGLSPLYQIGGPRSLQIALKLSF